MTKYEGMTFFQERAWKTRAARLLKRRFHGRPTLRAKAVPLYPISAEREFVRVAGSYMRLMQRAVNQYVPDMLRGYRKLSRADARFDGSQDAEDYVQRQIDEMAKRLEQVLYLFGLEDRIWKIARIARNTSLREWLRAVKATFGIDLETGYYNGEFYAEILDPWVADSVRRVESYVPETFGRIRRTLSDGIREHLSATVLIAAVLAVCRQSTRQCQASARNRVGNLNAALSKKHQTDAGCIGYVWHTAGDDRVRPAHQMLNGKTVLWDSPPQMWYETKKRGTVRTSQYCHPGEDYNCRCTAVPIFNQATLSLPLREEDWKREGVG